MALSVDPDTVFEDYWRTCDLCGRPRTRAQIQVRDNIAICYIHPGFRTARELDKLVAKRKPVTIKPVKGQKPFAYAPTYAVEEAQILDLVCSVAPYETRDVTSDGAGGITGDRSYQAAGWAIVYLLALYDEGRRPLAWRTQALVKAKELGDFLISLQYGNGKSPTLTKSTTVLYGALDLFWIATGSTGEAQAQDQGIAAVAFARLFQVTAQEKYRNAAKLTAHVMTNMTALELLSSSPTVRHYGAPAHVYFNSGAFFDVNFYPGDLVCLWGLTLILAIAGDGTYGADTTLSGLYASAPQRLLSTTIAQIRAFWLNGSGDATITTGLSSATPRQLFIPDTGFGAQWAGTSALSANWAAGLRSLFETEGISAQVADCWDFLVGFSSAASFETTTGTSTRVLLAGATGTYDPTIAPATTLDLSAAKNGSSFYDYGAAGLLAPIQASRGPAGLSLMKETLGTQRTRYFEGSPRDSRADYLGRLGRSGLSFQPFTDTNQRQESVTRAAQVGFAYRYQQTFGGEE